MNSQSTQENFMMAIKKREVRTGSPRRSANPVVSGKAKQIICTIANDELQEMLNHKVHHEFTKYTRKFYYGNKKKEGEDWDY